MGAPMAKNLASAGFAVRGFDPINPTIKGVTVLQVRPRRVAKRRYYHHYASERGDSASSRGRADAHPA